MLGNLQIEIVISRSILTISTSRLIVSMLRLQSRQRENWRSEANLLPRSECREGDGGTAASPDGTSEMFWESLLYAQYKKANYSWIKVRMGWIWQDGDRVGQSLVQWKDMSVDYATWIDEDDFVGQFPKFQS
ncbi:hypothetical protein OROGR_006569 [Orobanche gracilis]